MKFDTFGGFKPKILLIATLRTEFNFPWHLERKNQGTILYLIPKPFYLVDRPTNKHKINPSVFWALSSINNSVQPKTPYQDTC